MAIVIKATQSSAVELLESGVYMARTVQLIDLGVQAREYQGEKKSSQQKLRLTFELPTETIEVDGVQKPRWFSTEIGVSLHEKANLPKLLKSLGLSEQDFCNNSDMILNRPCQVEIQQYADAKNVMRNGVGTVTQPMKGMQIAELFGEPASFSMDDPDMDMWNNFPDWLKDKIRMAENFKDTPLFELDMATNS